MTQLLVSVRSISESSDALAGGAALIDIKEPTNGSLGRADDSTITAILRLVGGRTPVSSAMGELAAHAFPSVAGLSYLKWGLAGCANHDWRSELQSTDERLQRLPHLSRPVAVAYADWRRADAPPPEEIVAFAIEHRWRVTLFDTWDKDGTSLFDWLPPSTVAEVLRECRAAGVRVALAGSLGFDHLPLIRELQPDWLAVRGAVCRSGSRNGAIDPDRVRRLASALAPFPSKPAIHEGSPLAR
jgi:uncharacterized protein (UPF0264 family)